MEIDSLAPITCIETLRLVREEGTYEAALCLSRPPWPALSQARARFLHAEEEAYFSTLKFERRQSSYLVGRYCAKRALCRMLGRNDPASIAVGSGVFNQPVVSHAGANVQVSISHAGPWGAAIAFPEAHPMGVDIEEIEPDRADAIRSQLTATESNYLSSMEMPEIQALTLLWTVKEALSKTIRCGMMTPFTAFEVAAIHRNGDRFSSTFTNFAQYKATSLLFETLALSVVSPKNTIFHIQLDKTFHG